MSTAPAMSAGTPAVRFDPSLEVTVAIHDRRWLEPLPDATKLCESWIRHSLTAFEDRWRRSDGGAATEVACILTNDEEIRDLNSRFRGKNAATNVLSFVADPHGPQEADAPHILGDIIVSLETIEREAKEQNKSLKDHVAHMIVHGVMHLIGFDHLADAEAEDMEARETELLSALGIADPYEDRTESE